MPPPTSWPKCLKGDKTQRLHFVAEFLLCMSFDARIPLWEGAKRWPIRLKSLESLCSLSLALSRSLSLSPLSSISDCSPHPANFTFKMSLISTSHHKGTVEHRGFFLSLYKPPWWSLRLQCPTTKMYSTSESQYTFRSTFPTGSL